MINFVVLDGTADIPGKIVFHPLPKYVLRSISTARASYIRMAMPLNTRMVTRTYAPHFLI